MFENEFRISGSYISINLIFYLKDILVVKLKKNITRICPIYYLHGSQNLVQIISFPEKNTKNSKLIIQKKRTQLKDSHAFSWSGFKIVLFRISRAVFLNLNLKLIKIRSRVNTLSFCVLVLNVTLFRLSFFKGNNSIYSCK